MSVSILPNRLQILTCPKSSLRCIAHAVIRNLLFPRSRENFFSYTENALEVSIIADVSTVKEDFPPSGSPLCPGLVIAEDPFRALEIEYDYDESSGQRINELSAPLARAGISIFYLSTYQTDFVFVKERRLAYVISTLQKEDFVFVDLDTLDVSLRFSPPQSDTGSVGGQSMGMSMRGSTAFDDAEVVRKVAAMAAQMSRTSGQQLSGTAFSEDTPESGHHHMVLPSIASSSVPTSPAITFSEDALASSSSTATAHTSDRLATSSDGPSFSASKPIPFTSGSGSHSRRHPGDTSRLRHRRHPRVNRITSTTSNPTTTDSDDVDDVSSAVTDTSGSLPSFAYSLSPSSPPIPNVSRGFMHPTSGDLAQSPAVTTTTTASRRHQRAAWEAMLAEVRRETHRQVLSHTLRLVGLNRDYAEWWGVRLVKLIFYPDDAASTSTASFFSYTATSDGVSVVAEESVVAQFGENMVHMPGDGGQHEALRCIQVDLEQFGLDRYGIVFSMSDPLTSAAVNLLYLSTFKTANIIVHESDLENAVGILENLSKNNDTVALGADQTRGVEPGVGTVTGNGDVRADEVEEDEFGYDTSVTTEQLRG
ncbi:hypothetical protein M427DRAFT_136786 [Gonapodya prolifera JEL478]|uniref:CASTOR ACT domain-containing protein n=1 Tax=Gonapodya prolifera (strain JEL478) TaxID=1344416 RepID=A0A139A971_GONPJ|nr:hypothetical protein M427DRAFT_136786 [Gonapodya prolifera JEL478]|eukprot:KXS13208.1 hypothetical protein M427DRAFT_136786 [Gonapodya prolifera JEL478]